MSEEDKREMRRDGRRRMEEGRKGEEGRRKEEEEEGEEEGEENEGGMWGIVMSSARSNRLFYLHELLCSLNKIYIDKSLEPKARETCESERARLASMLQWLEQTCHSSLSSLPSL